MTRQINNHRKLGMGLSALLGNNNNTSGRITENTANSEQEIIKLLPINKIVAGIYQPRKYFDQAKLEELAESIRENDLIQPIIVRQADKERGIYEIVAGERRFRASKIAELKEIPVIVKNISDAQALEFSIIENIQRSDLSPIEEASSYKQLMVEFGHTQEQVANKIGRSRSNIANALRLLSLPLKVQEMINEGLISAGHARVIVNKNNALEVADKIIKESLSVRDTEDLLRDANITKNNLNKNNKNKIDLIDLKKRNLKNQYLRTVEANLSEAIGNNLKVKASYDTKKQKGKITISYNNLTQLEELIKNLSKSS